MFNRVAIVGVGLIGGSLGMGIIQRGLSREVIGIGRSPDNLREAERMGAVTATTTSLAEGVHEADLVIVATPVTSIIKSIREIAPHLASGTIVTDVGSTKQMIVKEAEEVMPDSVFFVGGHPMAGSEAAGVRFADRYLFEGAYYVLTPTPRTSPPALKTVGELVRAVGAKPIEMSPAAHDFAVAAISHLPHMVAVALVNAVGSMPGSKEIFSLAAGGFRDTTRVASGSPEVWRDIVATNREMLRAAIAHFRKELDRIDAFLEAGDFEALQDLLQDARELRGAVPAKAKGFLHDLFNLLLNIPDRPGSIAEVASVLAANSLNISDLEILRVREGEGGTVRLSFASREARDMAREVLKQAGITVF